MALCERCGEEIAVANELDRAGYIDRPRRTVLVDRKPRRLTEMHWRLFVLLCSRRGENRPSQGSLAQGVPEWGELLMTTRISAHQEAAPVAPATISAAMATTSLSGAARWTMALPATGGI